MQWYSPIDPLVRWDEPTERTWTRLGDHLALDSVNTVLWPDGTTRVELWGGLDAVHGWLAAEPVLLPADSVRAGIVAE